MNLTLESIIKFDDMLNSSDVELQNLGMATLSKTISREFADINAAKREICRRAYTLGVIHGEEIVKELQEKGITEDNHAVCVHFINFGIKQSDEEKQKHKSKQEVKQEVKQEINNGE